MITTLIMIFVAFISGACLGMNYESERWCKDMVDNFAETEHLRTENAYLRETLRMINEEEGII